MSNKTAVPIYMYVSPKDKALIEMIAETEGRSVSNFCSTCVNDFMKDRGIKDQMGNIEEEYLELLDGKE